MHIEGSEGLPGPTTKGVRHEETLQLADAVALGGCYAAVDSQGRMVGGGQATVTLGLPAVLPPLVVVQPGVSIVSDLDYEVFYADGYYWTRHEGGWVRTRDHRAGWTRVEPRYVPRPIQVDAPWALQALPRGRCDRGDKHDRDDRGRGRGEGRDRDD